MRIIESNIQTQAQSFFVVLETEERRLNWAHVTILHGNNEVPKPGQSFIQNHDIRIRFQNTKVIEPGTGLFNFLFPTGRLLSPVVLDKTNRRDPLKVAPHFAANHRRERISHVRVIERSTLMRKQLNDNLKIVRAITGEIKDGV